MSGLVGKSTLTSPGGPLVDPAQPAIGKRTLVEQASFGVGSVQHKAAGQGTPASAAPSADLGAVGPPAIDLGDQEIGSQTFHEAMIWNLEAAEASVVAHVEGDPSLQLVSAPARIFPSRELVNPDRRENKFRIVYSPTKRGRVSGVLRVALDWRAGVRRPVELVIPIHGAAHASGTPTLDEEAAEQRDRAEQQRAAAERDADEKRRQAKEDEDWKLGRVHGNEQSRAALDAATEGARIALASLFENRQHGVGAAWEDARDYKRTQPRHEASLLESLAMAGLEIATAGIAGAIARRLEGPLEKLLTQVTQPHRTPGADTVSAATVVPARHVIALLTDSVKEGVKTVGQAIQPEHTGAPAPQGTLGPAPPAPSESAPPLSANPMTSFFTREQIALTVDYAVEAHRVSLRTKAELARLLDVPGAARGAVVAMNKIADEIAAMNRAGEASARQAQASALHWMRYLAQASLGSISAEAARAAGKRVDPQGRPLTDIANVNLRSTAGLVEVTFAASAAHPEVPVAIRGVFVQGVSNALAQRLAHQTLREAGLAVRATGTPSDGDASLPVTVIRDEAGNLTYADQTRPPGLPGASWLARRAGDLRGGPSAELRGARKLMEEILNQRIPASLITTDSADGTDGEGR